MQAVEGSLVPLLTGLASALLGSWQGHEGMRGSQFNSLLFQTKTPATSIVPDTAPRLSSCCGRGSALLRRPEPVVAASMVFCPGHLVSRSDKNQVGSADANAELHNAVEGVVLRANEGVQPSLQASS